MKTIVKEYGDSRASGAKVTMAKTQPSYFTFHVGFRLSLDTYFLVGGDQFPPTMKFPSRHVPTTWVKLWSATHGIPPVLQIWRLETKYGAPITKHMVILKGMTTLLEFVFCGLCYI